MGLDVSIRAVYGFKLTTDMTKIIIEPRKTRISPRFNQYNGKPEPGVEEIVSEEIYRYEFCGKKKDELYNLAQSVAKEFNLDFFSQDENVYIIGTEVIEAYSDYVMSAPKLRKICNQDLERWCNELYDKLTHSIDMLVLDIGLYIVSNISY